MNFTFLPFSELSLEQLYNLLKLRVDVFVVEQQCAYAEIDNADQQAVHVLVTKKNELIGYARILFENQELHIGRIISHPDFRNTGLGTQIMKEAMNYCAENYPKEDIYLSAQAHLEEYYSRFGYKTISDVYDWDGIEHINMVFKV